MAISFRAITDDGDRKLHRLRLDDLGRLGLGGGEQGLGALDLRPVASQGDQELAGLDLRLVADGLVLGDAQADERPRQSAESGPRQGAFDAAEQGRGQRPGDQHGSDPRQDQERGPGQQAEDASRPRPDLGALLGDGPGRDEPERLLDRLEVLADDRHVLHRDALLLQSPHRVLGRCVVRVRGDDRRRSVRLGRSHPCSFVHVHGNHMGGASEERRRKTRVRKSDAFLSSPAACLSVAD
jgi:hypothetical protein